MPDEPKPKILRRLLSMDAVAQLAANYLLEKEEIVPDDRHSIDIEALLIPGENGGIEQMRVEIAYVE